MTTLAPTPPSAYGALVAASDVELALIAVVRTWIADYLAEVERQHGYPVGTLPLPRGWVISADIEKMPEDQTPTIIVGSPGLTDPPQADGQGRYAARWRVLLGVHLSARGNDNALRLARLYALALRALALQQQLLDPELAVVRIEWRDERYDVLDSIDDRTVCTGVVELAVQVADVTSRQSGPLEPLLPPLEPGEEPSPDSPVWPTAVSADALVLKP
jgi:hypothetical protein